MDACEVADSVAVEHPMPSLAASDIGHSTRPCPSEECTALDANDSLSLGRFDIKSSIDFCIIRRGIRKLNLSHIGVARKWSIGGKIGLFFYLVW